MRYIRVLGITFAINAGESQCHERGRLCDHWQNGTCALFRGPSPDLLRRIECRNAEDAECSAEVSA